MADCPYNQNDYTSWPSESAYSRAIPFRGGTAHWFWMTDTNGIKQAKRRLDSGYTTVIGIEVYSNFDNVHNYGYKYCVADTYGGDRGSHAITIVGYNDTMTTNDGTGAFKIINSWGTGWGQSGYCWMSYVAARHIVLSHQVGYYLDDLIGYSPTMLGRVKITHAARDKIGIRLGVGRPSSPNWQKNFRTWRYPRVDRSFPNNNIVFDMTEGEPYITNNTTDTVFVRAIDDVSDSKTGTINYFAATHLAWNATGISSDTPVSIPDYNVGVYARARIIRTDVGVTQITAPTDNRAHRDHRLRNCHSSQSPGQELWLVRCVVPRHVQDRFLLQQHPECLQPRARRLPAGVVHELDRDATRHPRYPLLNRAHRRPEQGQRHTAWLRHRACHQCRCHRDCRAYRHG